MMMLLLSLLLLLLHVVVDYVCCQVWERARRLGVAQAPLGDHVRLLVENRVEVIAGAMAALRPAAVVVDSIQTVALREVAGRPGSITQVRQEGEDCNNRQLAADAAVLCLWGAACGCSDSR